MWRSYTAAWRYPQQVEFLKLRLYLVRAVIAALTASGVGAVMYRNDWRLSLLDLGDSALLSSIEGVVGLIGPVLIVAVVVYQITAPRPNGRSILWHVAARTSAWARRTSAVVQTTWRMRPREVR